ncbi:MAG: PIN domain-containing protein [Desulfobacteraceae bacterium]|nr:PIN domain-containing protein [Desulfobacteraceae bacterium]
MILIVNDASILIDLLKVNLISSFFQLKYEFHVTDFVIDEVQEENVEQLHSFLQNKKLIKKVFNFEELREIQLLEVEHRALSIADCSCLYLADKLSAILLTGDAALRRITEQNKIPVHGILWIFDELLKYNLISPKTAYEKLKKAMSINIRLPVDECNKRLMKWKKD